MGWPSSMLSWVSKWLRDRSSVPANGTNATWRCRYIAPMVSRSAGASAQLPSSASAPLASATSGLAMAMVGRAS